MKSDNFFVQLLRRIWNSIRTIVKKVINFFKDIVSFFKNPARLRKIQNDENLLAIAIKDNLKAGDYNVVNCLFDQETNRVVDLDQDATGINASELDSEAENTFGNKSMIIFN